MRSHRAFAAATCTAALLLTGAACSKDTTHGFPTPATSPPTLSTGSRPQIPTDLPEPGPSTSSTSSAPSPLAGVGPCSVVPPAAVAVLGGSGAGEEKKLGLARVCSWNPPGKEPFGVAFFDTAGVKDTVGKGEKTSVQVGTGTHEAVQQDGGGVCAVSIGMSATSRVDVQVGGFPPKSCEQAKSFADTVEPLLPPQVK